MSLFRSNGSNLLANIFWTDHPSPSCGLFPTNTTSESPSLHDASGSSQVANPAGLGSDPPPTLLADLSDEVLLSGFAIDEEHQENILSSPQENMILIVESSQGNMTLTGEKARFPCGELEILSPGEASVQEQAKRARSPNWSPKEKQALLELKVEALQVITKGKDWDWISKALRDKHKIERTAKGCEDQWTPLMKAFKAILPHEGDYWDMDAYARSARSLPPSFSRQWYEMMKTILAGKKLKRPCSTEPGSLDQLLNTLTPLIRRQVECDVNSALEGLRSSAVISVAGDEILTPMAPKLKQQVETAVISTLLLHALTGNLVVDHPASDISKCTKKALDSALQPVADVLQKMAREEEEDGAELRAIRQQRQALDLKEKQIESKRQCRLGRQQTSKTISNPRKVRRGMNHSIVAPLQELKIVEEVIMPDDEYWHCSEMEFLARKA